MITVIKETATPEQLDQFVSWIEGRGFKTNVSQGDNETIVGIIGDTTRIDPFLLESMDIVERVQRVTEPYKLANRKFHPEDTVVDCGHGVLVGGGNFQVIAERGLDLLMEAGAELGMPVVTEVMDPRDVAMFVEKGVDVLQIGARNAQNFPLLREVGRAGRPVLLKRGMSETIDELLMSAEYVMSEGNADVMLCERGIRTFETRTRNTFDVNAVYTRYVRPAAYAATAAGADGLEVEVHDCPQAAWSDGAQALTPRQFEDAMRRIALIREAVCADLPEEE